MVAQDFKQGDRVKWNTPQGETYGKVKKRLTSSTEVGGQKINASAEDPRSLIESEKSGNESQPTRRTLAPGVGKAERWQTSARRP